MEVMLSARYGEGAPNFHALFLGAMFPKSPSVHPIWGGGYGGFLTYGISKARTLGSVATFSSRGSSGPRVFCISRQILHH